MYQFLQFGHILTHVEKHLIQYLALALKALALILHAKQGRQTLRIVLFGQIVLQNRSVDFAIGFDDGNLFRYILQLAYVTGP